MEDAILDLEDTSIGDVLEHAEEACNHAFLSRHATLFEALELFEASEARGTRLEAVLISENGRPREQLMGIVTVADLPKLLAELKP